LDEIVATPYRTLRPASGLGLDTISHANVQVGVLVAVEVELRTGVEVGVRFGDRVCSAGEDALTDCESEEDENSASAKIGKSKNK